MLPQIQSKLHFGTVATLDILATNHGSVENDLLTLESKLHPLKLTANAPEIGQAPKGNDRIPTIHFQMSHEKNLLSFHYTGCLIGMLIIVHYNHITG